jgi:FkbM family methyltransferase
MSINEPHEESVVDAWSQPVSIDERRTLEESARAGAESAFSNDGFLRAHVLNQYWMYVEPDDIAMTPWLISDGFWEAWVTLWLKRHIQPGSVFIDVGANVGYFTMFAASQGAKVLAVEPNAKVAALLSRSAEEAGFSDVLVLNQALSDRTQLVELNIPEGHSGGASIFDVETSKFSIPTLAGSLDRILRNLPEFGTPSVIKIDAEGAEPQIVKGMQECLSRNPDCLVLLEWDSERFADADAHLDGWRSWGYGIYVVLPTGGVEALSNESIHGLGMQMLVLRRRESQLPVRSVSHSPMVEDPRFPLQATANYPHGHLWSVRLGFKHIPKCAGISLSLAIHEAWGLKYFGLLQVQKSHGEPILFGDENVVLNRELNLWRDRSFVAGHLPASDFRLLNRTFLFTVIRDPVDRSLSAYAYLLRMAQLQSTQLRNGQLSDEQKLTLEVSPSEWLAERQRNQMLASLIRGGTPTLLAREDVGSWLKEIGNHSEGHIREVIRDCLSQFDVVYLGNEVNRIVENLFLQGLLPQMPNVSRMNVAKPIDEPPACDVEQLFHQLLSLTHADQLVVDEAVNMFPGYIYEDCRPNFERFRKLAERYGFGD